MESKKHKTIFDAEEDHLVAVSTKKKDAKTSKKLIQVNLKYNQIETEKSNSSNLDTTNEVSFNVPNVKEEDIVNKKKIKSKKLKKCEHDNQNISVKASFSKFDALQKRNIIHVRSSDSGKAQKIFSNPQDERQRQCRLCDKPVYKMEEINIEKAIYHKNCFRCVHCSKQLRYDNYQSYEDKLYCNVHFKVLFAPKIIEDDAAEMKPRKAELIIRENQPLELPPDIARASDKPDLGLEGLMQLNVRSRFQIFENSGQEKQPQLHPRESKPLNCNSSTISKMMKLQQQGLNVGINNEKDGIAFPNLSYSEDEASTDENNSDLDYVRSKQSMQKERPVGLGDAMNDIKNKFEKGHMLSKEERREERKQEIQNIRSRLFLGKQAKIKEMYQQAVADSEQAITSVGKKPEGEFNTDAQAIKELFETGCIFNSKESANINGNSTGLSEDVDVFESGISKKSRSIFLELDSNIIGNSNNNVTQLEKSCSGLLPKTYKKNYIQNQHDQKSLDSTDLVKYDDKPPDVKVATSELSEKFKFFETYRPSQGEKRQFRITPPREGVVKMPSPDLDGDEQLDQKFGFNDDVLQKSQTTSAMVNKFQEMEQIKKNFPGSNGPKPLKCFTPPPPDDSHYEEEDNTNESDESESDDEPNNSQMFLSDEGLKEAQSSARAKHLRAKFEKWQTNEMQRDMNEGRIDVYSQQVSDDSTIESTKIIRERFENMKSSNKVPSGGLRHQVNRFVVSKVIVNYSY